MNSAASQEGESQGADSFSDPPVRHVATQGRDSHPSARRVLRTGKPIAEIIPIAADLPSWQRRRAQPLVLDGVSVSRMILEERETAP